MCTACTRPFRARVQALPASALLVPPVAVAASRVSRRLEPDIAYFGAGAGVEGGDHVPVADVLLGVDDDGDALAEGGG